MEQSFVFFTEMRSRMILDSQIKIAYLYRKLVKLRKRREEEARLEEERLKAEKMARRKTHRGSNYSYRSMRSNMKKPAPNNKDLEVTATGEKSTAN